LVVDGAGAGSATLRYLRLVSGVHPRIAFISPVAQALVVAAGMALAQPAAGASPPDAGADPTTQDAGELEDVRQLYEEGKAKFDTYDYAGAIDLWTKAYAKLEPVEGNREIRNNLVYNIATAQEKAFEINGEVVHLRQARALLQRYLDEYKSLYRPTDEGREEVAKVEARIQEIDDRIAGAQQGGGAASVEPPPPAQPDPERERAKLRAAKTKELLRSDPEISQDYKSGRGMMVGGIVSLGIGATFALGALSSWGSTEAGTTGRTTVITVVALGSALAVTGSVLLAIGVPKRNRARDRAREKAASLIAGGPGARVVITPTLSTQMLGLQVGTRF
jgi:hypothetical protein